MKRIALTALAMVFFMAACGDSDSDSGDSAATSAATTSDAGAAATTSEADAGAASTTAASGEAADPEMAAMTAFAAEEMPNVTPDVLQAACEEGTVEVLHNAVDGIEQLEVDFEEKLPCINANIVLGADDDLLARFLVGVSQGQPADILNLGSQLTLRTQVEQEGLLKEYIPSGADQLSTLSPGFFYPEGGQSQGIAFNTDAVDPAMFDDIETWADVEKMLGPEWDGLRMGMVDPHGAGGGSYTTAYVLTQEIGSDNVAALVDKFDATMYTGSGAAADALVAGEVDLVFGNEFAALQVANDGAPVQVHFPSPRSVTEGALGIAADGPNPNAAIVFYEYMLSRYGQALFSELTSIAPARADVEDTRAGTQLDWYHLPTELYEFDIDDMISSYETVVAPFPTT